MSLLLYAIFQPRPGAAFPTLDGVNGLPVFEIGYGRRLAAAVSESPAPEPAPDHSILLAYEKIVAALHRSPSIDGVIPMRFGSRLSCETHVRRLLREHGTAYRALLREIQGCEEMGIRFFLPAPSVSEHHDESCPEVEIREGSEHFSPARAYIETRRNYYAARDRVASEKDRRIEQYSVLLGGVFRQMRSECRIVRDPGAGRSLQLISLYFLVPRPNLPDFYRKVDDIRKLLPSGLLLNGPWPPFNFVLPETPPVANSTEKKKVRKVK